LNYTYDGDGDRVQKSNGKIYWYGAGSQVLDESDASGNITDEYVYFEGKRVGHRVVSSNSVFYYAEDMLGSSRQSSWDNTKPLPDDPSKLGPDWRKNDDHKHPHGDEYINDKTGEKLEWNKGRPGPWGPSSDRGKDGWHHTPAGGTRGKQLDPGSMVRKYAPAVATATIVVGAIAIGHAIIESAPVWLPLLAL
jgi:hypothetical protein